MWYMYTGGVYLLMYIMTNGGLLSQCALGSRYCFSIVAVNNLVTAVGGWQLLVSGFVPQLWRKIRTRKPSLMDYCSACHKKYSLE